MNKTGSFPVPGNKQTLAISECSLLRIRLAVDCPCAVCCCGWIRFWRQETTPTRSFSGKPSSS